MSRLRRTLILALVLLPSCAPRPATAPTMRPLGQALYVRQGFLIVGHEAAAGILTEPSLARRVDRFAARAVPLSDCLVMPRATFEAIVSEVAAAAADRAAQPQRLPASR